MHALCTLRLAFGVDTKEDPRNFLQWRAFGFGIEEPCVKLDMIPVIDGDVVFRGRKLFKRRVGRKCHYGCLGTGVAQRINGLETIVRATVPRFRDPDIL